MAYRFDGVDDDITFALGPLNGYTIGPVTIAVFYKPAAVGINNDLVGIGPSGSNKALLRASTINNDQLRVATTNATGPHSLADTSKWYLLVVNWSGAGGTPRFHVHDGSSWNHANASGSIAANAGVIGAGDLLKVGRTLNYGNHTIVCAGIKKADISADATIETLSRTSFQAWRDFGFEWLVGFDDAATVTNEMGGGGDETSRTGTTLVSDPPGWVWTVPTVIGRFTRLKLGDGLTGSDQGAGVIELAATGDGGAGMFFTGSGPPTAGTGVDGSIYLDYTSFRFWGPKAAGAWPATAFARAIALAPTYDDIKDG